MELIASQLSPFPPLVEISYLVAQEDRLADGSPQPTSQRDYAFDLQAFHRQDCGGVAADLQGTSFVRSQVFVKIVLTPSRLTW